MEEMTYDMEKVDDVMPGFPFHPTDEELVNFYLKRKVQQKSLPIELIKQVDIYKYDPWDLPMLASSGEKEWYFYCPRDRKYRNSVRPNRVTKGGFWKATGTDKAIYSSEGKCIGLKKSLVFYKGKAAKGAKTDWMMHEFRLPSKKFSDKSFSLNDKWTICRILMKANSSNNVQKALSHPWISQLPGSMVFDLLTKSANYNQFSSENISCTTTQLGTSSNSNNNNNFSVSNIPTTYTQQISNNSNTISKPSQIHVSNGEFADNFQTLEATSPTKCIYDASSLLTNNDFIGFEETNQQFSGLSISLPNDMQTNEVNQWESATSPSSLFSNNDFIGFEEANQQFSGLSISLPNDMQTNEWESAGRTIGFPFNLSPNDAWMGLTQ